jgi:glutathione synthase
MDPIESISIETDTTYQLMCGAQNKGHTLYYYTPEQIALRDGHVTASVQKVHLTPNEEPYYTLGKPREIDLSTMDVVLIRQDPPYDMPYLTLTYFLDKITDTTLVVNAPQAVRDCPEKLFVTQFSELTPPTLITRDESHIHDFVGKHQDVVIKPLYAFGGKDIFHITQKRENYSAIVEIMLEKYQEPLIVQTYLKNINKSGDKRIILIDGEAVGALNRFPQEGEVRSNMVRGGDAQKTTLTERDREICEALKPELQKRNILLAGIDVIDGWLTEINITSPTGVKTINHLDNANLEDIFWEKAAEKVAELRQK